MPEASLWGAEGWLCAEGPRFEEQPQSKMRHGEVSGAPLLIKTAGPPLTRWREEPRALPPAELRLRMANGAAGWLLAQLWLTGPCSHSSQRNGGIAPPSSDTLPLTSRTPFFKSAQISSPIHPPTSLRSARGCLQRHLVLGKALLWVGCSWRADLGMPRGAWWSPSSTHPSSGTGLSVWGNYLSFSTAFVHRCVSSHHPPCFCHPHIREHGASGSHLQTQLLPARSQYHVLEVRAIHAQPGTHSSSH